MTIIMFITIYISELTIVKVQRSFALWQTSTMKQLHKNQFIDANTVQK